MHVNVAQCRVKELCSVLFLCVLQEPLKLDIVISFPDHGFHLRFDPWSQVLFLKMIMRFLFKRWFLFNQNRIFLWTEFFTLFKHIFLKMILRVFLRDDFCSIKIKYFCKHDFFPLFKHRHKHPAHSILLAIHIVENLNVNHALYQRLRLIEIFDVKRLQMRYATALIG